MTDPFDKAWSAACRAILKVTAVPQSMGDKAETGIDWAVRMIKALDEKANRVPGLVLEIHRLNESAYKATFGFWGRGEWPRETERDGQVRLQLRVNALTTENIECNRQRGLAHDQVARLHREVGTLEKQLDVATGRYDKMADEVVDAKVELADAKQGSANKTDTIKRLHTHIHELGDWLNQARRLANLLKKGCTEEVEKCTCLKRAHSSGLCSFCRRQEQA